MTPSSPKPTQVLVATTITFFLLLLNNVNSFDDALSFSFSKFVPDGENLIFDVDASVSSTGVLEITKVVDGEPAPILSRGRARYVAPVHIWDRTTGKVASFSTSFSFVMKVPDGVTPASGLTFFLSPPDAIVGRNGRFLGLFQDANNDPSNQIVAVEFDTYYVGSIFDPDFQHIGVDVNGPASIKYVRWDMRENEEALVNINYVARTKTLSASLTYPSDQTSYIVSTSVDLKAILPEWVRVGFSAGISREFTETNDIHRWSFASTFKDNNCVADENNLYIARDTDKDLLLRLHGAAAAAAVESGERKEENEDEELEIK